MLYLVTVTFSWFFKVHFEFLPWKCQNWNISVVFCRGLPCHSYILLIFQSSFWISFVEMQELEYFSSVLLWFIVSQLHFLDFQSSLWIFFVEMCLLCFTLTQLHFLDFSKFIWISFVEMQELEYFSSVLLWFTLSLLHSLDFSKFILEFLSLKCKSWNISVVFCRGLPCQTYILLICQSSFWISFVEMQELEYFSSVLMWFTLSQLHSLDFSKFILVFFRWNARVGLFQ